MEQRALYSIKIHGRKNSKNMKKNKNSKIENTDIFSATDETFSLSIGELMGREKPQTSPETPPAPPPPSAPHTPQDAVGSFAQVTLHRQSAGRGGKTVTLVAIKPPQAPAMLETLAGALRKDLGCGSRVEEGRIVLQGNIPDRAQEWFVKKGARKVVRGN